MMKIGNNLKRIREIKGFSQSEIAAKLFISQRAYSDLENDKTKLDIERLESIAIIFNISSNDLLTFDENKIFQNNALTTTGNSANESNNSDAFINEKKSYEKQINRLEEEILFLREIIKQKK